MTDLPEAAEALAAQFSSEGREREALRAGLRALLEEVREEERLACEVVITEALYGLQAHLRAELTRRVLELTEGEREVARQIVRMRKAKR